MKKDGAIALISAISITSWILAHTDTVFAEPAFDKRTCVYEEAPVAKPNCELVFTADGKFWIVNIARFCKSIKAGTKYEPCPAGSYGGKDYCPVSHDVEEMEYVATFDTQSECNTYLTSEDMKSRIELFLKSKTCPAEVVSKTKCKPIPQPSLVPAADAEPEETKIPAM